MGQQEVFSFLKKNRNKWFTTKQIIKGLKASAGSVTTSLKKLRDSGQINFKMGAVDFRRLGGRRLFAYKFKNDK